MSSADQSDYQRMSPRDKLAAARLKARQDSPYFASALLNLIPKEAPGLGTLGVTEGMILMWDSEAIQSWPLEELSATLEHEVMHVLRGHAARARKLGIIGSDGKSVDPQLSHLWNLAGDCEINDDFEKTRPYLFSGPRGSVLPKQFKLANGLLAESYYDAMRQQQQQQKGQKGGQGDTKHGQNPPDGAGAAEGDKPGEQKGRPRAGRCGSCAGNPNAGEPQAPGASGKQEAAAGGGQEGGDGDGGRTEAEVDRIRKQVAHEIKDYAAKGRGNIPGGWIRWADEKLAPPKVRWQDKLARLARAAVAWKAGQVDLRHDRTSRRQWGIGVGVGRPMIPALRAPVPKVAVAIDTSGSMGAGELTSALREAAGVLAAVGAQVTLATCDAAVHGLQRVRSVADVRKQLKGGGGTDFCPVFAAMDKAPGGRPDVLIFITDGGGPAPAQAPHNMKVIWLLVGEHRCKPMSPWGGWGEVIEVDEL